MLGDSLNGEWTSVEAEEPALVFEDQQHLSDALIKLNTLRKEGQLCDVHIQVGRASLPAHRAVLACTSGYLMELFTEDEGNQRSHFKLPNVHVEAFQIIVNYAYTSRLEVAEDLITNVYKTAILLKVPRVAEACSEYLAKNLTLTNCLAIRGFANSTRHAELTQATDAYIRHHMDGLADTPVFATLPSMKFDIIGVSEEDLQESGEENVSQLVVNWLEAALHEQRFHSFTENPHVLYLTEDNVLRDCLNLQADKTVTDAERDLADMLHSSDVVQDYVKLSKRKQIPAVKGSKITQRPHQQQPMNGQLSAHGRQSSIEKLNTVHQEWKLIGTCMVQACSCLCVAMLDETLTVIHLKFRPYPQDVEDTTSDPENKSKKSTPVSSPRHSVVLEKYVSLTPLATMNQGRCGVGSAVVQGHLLVVGGYDRGECLDSMECYNPQTNGWTLRAPMISPRGRFDIAQIDNKLYACGGSNGSQDLKSAEMYDWETDQWARLPDMKYERSSPGVAALNNKVYVIGGWSGCSGIRKCEMYDPSTNKWTVIADMPSGRSQAGVCTMDNKIIVVGGCDAWNCTNTVQMYDPDKDEWSNLPYMVSNRRGAGVGLFDGRLYVVGGSDGQSSLSSVEIFDRDHMTWTHGPAMGIPRANASVAVLSDRLFAVGGFSGKHFLDTIECLGKEKKEWCGFAARMSSGTSDGSGESASEMDSNCESEAGDHMHNKRRVKCGNDAKRVLPMVSAKLKANSQNSSTVLANGDHIPATNGHIGNAEVQQIADKIKICDVSNKDCPPITNGLTNGHNVDAHINGTTSYS